MQDPFDFLVDFQTLADIPLSKTLDKEASPETEYFVEIIQNEKKRYQCAYPNCGKTFRYKSEANRHIIIHQKEKPYSCTFRGCKKAFKRPETLQEHKRIHEGELPYQCDKPGCERRFVSKPALRYHQLRHKNKPEFKCGIGDCQKRFLTMQHLKQHQASGLHCNKSFSDSTSEKRSYKIYRSESESDVSEQIRTPSENAQWEKKGERDGKMKEMSELLQNILSENQILKERIQRVDENQSHHRSFQYTHSILFSEVAESYQISDSHELNVLDFLNGKGNNDF